MCGTLSITTPVSILANEFDVRGVLYGQVSVAAVNQIRVIHEAMNGCKTVSLKDCFENVNISIVSDVGHQYFPHTLNKKNVRKISRPCKYILDMDAKFVEHIFEQIKSFLNLNQSLELCDLVTGRNSKLYPNSLQKYKCVCITS